MRKKVIEKTAQCLERDLDELMSDRFGRYSKYIIQERALPDARDGLKPVQRRILYAMNEDGNTFDKPHRKAAKAVGYIIGYYHPHGDSSVYEAIVRLSQAWKMNLPLIDMQGNNGSIDDDPPAAMRYTECRLAPIAGTLLADINQEAVPFTYNYDDSLKEPTVLPAPFPLLLVNGSTGIASGYATNIAPHNLNEVIDATIYRLLKPDCALDELLEFIKGPDFPTGAIVQGKENIKEVFATGRGRVVVRAKCEKKETGSLKQLIITELPYEVVKINLVKKLDDIRLNKEIDGILDVRDESGRDGLRIVIDLKKECDSDLVLNYFYKNTDLQINYNYNMIAIVNHRPVLMNLFTCLDSFIAFRKETVINRSKYLLKQKEERMQVIEGLIKALSILDEVIELIRHSEDKADAKKRLIREFSFLEIQAEAIVNLRLYRLTNTDIRTLQAEFTTLVKEINELKAIISSAEVLKNLLIRDLKAVKERYGYARRTVIEETISEIVIDKTSMIADEPCVVAVTKAGYVKRISLRSYNAAEGQLPAFKEGDILIGYGEMQTLDTLLLFTDRGNYLYLPVYVIDECRFKDLGRHFSTYIKAEASEKIVSVFHVHDFNSYAFAVIATAKGLIKKTLLADYKVQRYSKTLQAVKLGKDDEVIAVKVAYSGDEVMPISSDGYYNRYSLDVIQEVGTKAKGIKAMALKTQRLADLVIVHGDVSGLVLINDQGGFKRIRLNELALTARAIRGNRLFKAMKTKEIKILKAYVLNPRDELLIYHGESKLMAAADLAWMSVKATFSNIYKLSANDFVLDLSTKGIEKVVWHEAPPINEDQAIEQLNLL